MDIQTKYTNTFFISSLRTCSIILFIILPLIGILGCKKDDDQNQDPVDLLPPATQTGAGTFAALVDGKPYIDIDGGWFNCFYQLIDGGYYFGVQGHDDVNSIVAITLSTKRKEIFEGDTYALQKNLEGNVWGGGGFSSETIPYQLITTNNEFTGELTITKMDFTRNIVSGTFWFDLEHPVTGERVEIREGRFDTLFTQ